VSIDRGSAKSTTLAGRLPEETVKGCRLQTKFKFIFLSVACLSLAWAAWGSMEAEAQSFRLKNGDTVVFYGDSITAQSLYTQWVELYTVTRFPGMRVHFYNAGVGGDRVNGGSGGTIDERLARDVFPHRPSVITVMLGMNDGSYTPFTEKIQSAYTSGYEHLLQSIHEHAPGARVTLLGPSPLDDVTRPVWFPGGYNSVLREYAELDRNLARSHNASFVNFNPPVVALLEHAEAFDPNVARLLLPDRVHPDVIAHWVMAETLLKAWDAPAEVSSVIIDANAVKLVEAQNATVSGLTHDDQTLHWSEKEEALPLPFDKGNATLALLFQSTAAEPGIIARHRTGAGPLRAGHRRSTCRQVFWRRAQSRSQSRRICNPMRDQAQRVAWLIADRDQAHGVHMRMLIRNADLGLVQGKEDVVDVFESSLEDAIYAEAVPKVHLYTLSRADHSGEKRP
jgi:lysophospholipase L1-like esterase